MARPCCRTSRDRASHSAAGALDADRANARCGVQRTAHSTSWMRRRIPANGIGWSVCAVTRSCHRSVRLLKEARPKRSDVPALVGSRRPRDEWVHLTATSHHKARQPWLLVARQRGEPVRERRGWRRSRMCGRSMRNDCALACGASIRRTRSSHDSLARSSSRRGSARTRRPLSTGGRGHSPCRARGDARASLVLDGAADLLQMPGRRRRSAPRATKPMEVYARSAARVLIQKCALHLCRDREVVVPGVYSGWWCTNTAQACRARGCAPAPLALRASNDETTEAMRDDQALATHVAEDAIGHQPAPTCLRVPIYHSFERCMQRVPFSHDARRRDPVFWLHCGATPGPKNNALLQFAAAPVPVSSAWHHVMYVHINHPGGLI